MRRSFFALTLTLAAPFGCHDDHTAPPAGSPCADRARVSLPDCESAGDRFTDEACIPLDDALRLNRATVNDARAAVVTAPAEMQAIPAAAPFTFTFTAPTAMLPERRPITVGDELRRWITFIPEADAHCEAFTGRAYELRFAVGNNVALRRQQSALTYTPTASEWSALTAAVGSQTATLTVYTAQYVSNAISPNTGPFYPSSPRRFTLMR